MKKGKKRLLAILLTVIMVLQQSALPAVSAETTPESATVAVQEAKVSEATTEAKASETTTEAKVSETTTEAKASETTTEAKASETTTEAKAPETTTEAKAPETTTEAKAPETTTEAKAPETTTEAKVSETTTEAKAPETTTEAKAPETTTEARAPETTTEAVSVVNVLAKEPEEKDVEPVTEYNLEDCIDSAEIKVKIGNEWYPVPNELNGFTVPKDAPVEVKIAYNPDDVKFAPGAKLIYQIPEGIKITKEQTGEVKDGPSKAGTYVIDQNGQIIITLDDEYIKKHDGHVKNGTISFSGSFNSSKWGQGGDKEIVFGDVKVTIPFTPDQTDKKGEIDITKSVIKNGDQEIKKATDDEGNEYYYIEYKIEISTPSDNTMTMKDITVEDFFKAGGEYINTVNGHPDIFDDTKDIGEFAYDKDAGRWKWTGIGDMKAGERHELTFKVKLNDKIHEDGNVSDRIVENRAIVKSEGKEKNAYSAITKENSSLNIKKTTAGYDAATGKVSYTVIVTASEKNTWDINNVRVEDIFGDNKQYVDRYGEVIPSKGTITNSNSQDTDKKLLWDIGTMAPGEKVTLTYTVDVNDNIFLQGTNGIIVQRLQNTANLYVNNQPKGNSSADVNFKKVWIWKNGQLQNDGRVKFTIHANEKTTVNNKPESNTTVPPIDANITFHDKLSGDWEYDGDIVIQRYTTGPQPMGTEVEGPVKIHADGTQEWNWTDPKEGAYFYEIIYFARLKNPVIGTPSISNTAGIGIGVGDNNYNHETTWSGSGKRYDSLSKEFKSLNGHIASWQSKITCNVPTGTVYEDYRDNKAGHKWTFSDEQIQGITVTAYKDAGRITLEKGSDYEVKRTGSTKDSFQLTFLKPFEATTENPILIDYSCTLNPDNRNKGEYQDFVNKANLTINGHTDYAEAQCSDTKEPLIEKTAGTYDPKTGEMTWKIKVNSTGTMKGEAIVTDELPEGLEYVEDSAEIAKRGNKATDTKMEEVSVSENKRIVTMKLTNLKDTYDKEAFVQITLKSKIVDESFLAGNKKQIFTNTAHLDYDGDDTISSSADQEVSNTTLIKEGQYNSSTAPDIVYHVTVNPNGLDMLKNGSTITVEDQMGDHMMLNTDSLVVKASGKNITEEVKASLQIKGNKFWFDVPDDQPIDITYKAYVMGEVGEHVTVTNTVTYSGQASTDPVKEENEIVIAESNATIEGNPAFYIKKIDGLGKTSPLQGAVYQLYTVNKENGKTDEVRTETSDSDGFVYFSDLDADIVYAFREIQAPEGYHIDEDNIKMTYVAFNRNAITEGMKDLQSQIQIIQSGYTYERFNYKGQVEIEKQFININNQILNGEYYFGLFNDKEGNNLVEGKVDKIVVENGKVLNTIIFNGIDVGPNGTAKTYYVYETDSKGKILSKNSDDTVLINGIKFEVSGEGAVQVSGDQPNSKITITNTIPLEIGFEASKEFTNVADTTYKEFKFGLYNKDGELIEEAKNDVNGKILFSKISYTRKDLGEHVYTIKEIVPDGVTPKNPTKDGITYDFTEYKVVVAVEYTADTDLITVTVKVGKEVIKEVTKGSGVYVLPNKENANASFVNKFAGSVKLTKTDGNDKVLADAEFELYKEVEGKEAELVEKFVTGKDGIVEKQNLSEGKYYFVETKAPIGYAIKMNKEGKPKHYSFEIGPNGGEQVVDYAYEVANELIQFNVNKVDIDGSKEVAGAELTVYGKDAEGKYTVEIDKWVSKEGETHDFGAKLEAGKEYVLRETVAPEGYAYTADIEFKVEADGSITTGAKKVVDDKTKEVTYLVEDKQIQFNVNKVNIDGSKEVAGAELTVYGKDAEGKYTVEIDKWVSKEGETHDFGAKLEAGKEYVLRETVAPEGYAYTADIEFKVEADGSITTGAKKVVDDKTKEVTYLVEDKQIQFNVNKVNIDGSKEVAGAELTVYGKDAEGKYTVEIDKWVSKEGETHDFGAKLEAGKEYVLRETVAPEGYAYTADIEFKVEADGSITTGAKKVVDDKTKEVTYLVEDKQIQFNVNKVNIDGSKEVAGAELTVYGKDAEGKYTVEIDKWVSKEGETHDFGSKLEAGKEYVLRETVAPEGYAYTADIEFKVEADGSITTGAKKVVDDKTKEVTYLVEDKQIQFNVNKVNIDGSKEVAGAELTVYGKDAEGKYTVEIDKWVSEIGKTHDFGSKLEAGKEYVLRETVAPEGYAYAVEIEFKVEADGTITTEAKKVVDKKTKEVTYLVEDKQIHFNVNKVELDNTKEVAGAELTVYGKDAEGKYTVEIDKWVSEIGKTHDFGSKLEAGKEYVLRETAAPEGYAYTFDIEFKVEADGTITTSAKKVVDDKTKEVTYLVEDDITRMTILKVDESGNGVAGARLALKDEAGKLMTNEDGTLKYSWVTTGEPHPLGGIPAGNYILTELEAPEGYEVADDVTFTLDDTAGAVNEVVMVDKKTPETSKGSLTVTKKIELKGHEDVIINLDEATFYVALFSDKDRTHRISNVKPIVFKNQQASEVVFDNLAAGTYYVGETDVYGNLLANGYWNEVVFNPVYGDGYTAKLESNTFAAQVHFKNVFEEAPDGAFYEGTIDITKEVLKDGKAYKTDNVYYAGIFYDKEYTDLLDKVELKMDGKSSTTVSVTVPLGTDPDEKVNFYVTEVDKNGTPLKNGPKLKFKVTVKEGNIVMSVDEPTADVTITNAYETLKGKTTKGAKTGDDMNLWGTIALMILSAAGVLAILLKRRKYVK